MHDPYLSGEYASNNPQWHQEHSQWKASQIRRMLAKHEIRPTRIAEVGCGAGGILESLRHELKPKPECIGYEVSPQAFAIAITRRSAGLDYRQGNPIPGDGPFDLIIAMDVIEHVEDYIGFIRNLTSLAPWKIFHVPLDLSVISIARPLYLEMARERVGHIHYFTRETALASICQAGLRISDWFYTSVEFDQGVHGQKRLQGLRKYLFARNADLAARWLGGVSLLVLAQ